jgi:chitinase
MRRPYSRRNVLRGLGLFPFGLGCASTGGALRGRPGQPGGPSLRPPAAGSTPGRPFRVVGYFPSRAQPDGVRYRELTHINYAFTFPMSDGHLRPFRNPERLAAIVRGARAQGVKVAISVGGWHGGDDSAFETLAADDAARAVFVEELAAFVARHELDGVDMDWEYPGPGQSAHNNVLLMKALRARLGTDKLLTAAVVGDGEEGEGILPEVFEYADFINIMAYDNDEHGQRPHSPYEYAVTCVEYWKKRGLPRGKLVLGVPFYGKMPESPYRELVSQDPRAPEKDQIGGVHYNGLETIKRKTTLALAQGSGIMIWEITQDTSDQSSLLRAIHETVSAHNVVGSYHRRPDRSP